MAYTVTIHQPEHLPWLGFFDKIKMADLYIVLDNVQFRKNYFQNRNRIRVDNKAGWSYVTVPLNKFSSSAMINEIKINYETDWQKSNWNKIRENYQQAPFFEIFAKVIKEHYFMKCERLVDFNLDFIKLFKEIFKIDTKIILASDIEDKIIKGGTEVNFNLCKKTHADVYLSGQFGKDYLDLNKFREADIEVNFHNFLYPNYPQQYGSFVSGMSALDYLFNVGTNF